MRIRDAFVGFANRVPFYGMAVVCLDDPNVAAACFHRFHKRVMTYAIDRADADYVAAEIRHERSADALPRADARQRPRHLRAADARGAQRVATRWPASPSATSTTSPPRSRDALLPSSRACSGASPSADSSRTSWWSTTTGITPPRSEPPLADAERAGMGGGSSR